MQPPLDDSNGISDAAPFETEEFWEDLLAFTEDGRVLPVVGPELLTVDRDGDAIPVYRAVAEALLGKYRISADRVALRKNHELNDAVSALAASGKRVRDLYRPVHDILQQLLAAQTEPLPALRELAAIHHFDLFASTTPDDLLARAIDAVRFTGERVTDQIEYAPKLPTERRRDIPVVPAAEYAAIFYLFGKADVSPVYAIHDEDALEFSYTLQAGNGPERLFAQLRSRNLLLIGCNFADWLSRFFLRLSSSERLFSDQRGKKEFLVGEGATDDGNLVRFLQRFSQDSRCYPIGARAFVGEFHRRWRERNPPAVSAGPGAADLQAGTSLPAGSIFISYSSDDLGAAKNVCESLKEIGGDVAWFDKGELKPGDDWNRQIRGAIQRCSLFLPLISSQTERRTEGYFRLEWHEASERLKRIQGRRFIFPLVIDPGFAGAGAYELVPEPFKGIQFAHAPDGRLTDRLIGEFRNEIRALRRAKGL